MPLKSSESKPPKQQVLLRRAFRNFMTVRLEHWVNQLSPTTWIDLSDHHNQWQRQWDAYHRDFMEVNNFKSFDPATGVGVPKDDGSGPKKADHPLRVST